MPRPDPLLQRNQRKMKALLNELTTREGLHPTVVEGVSLARADCGFPRTPVLYEPCICVLASGRALHSWRQHRTVEVPVASLARSLREEEAVVAGGVMPYSRPG